MTGRVDGMHDSILRSSNGAAWLTAENCLKQCSRRCARCRDPLLGSAEREAGQNEANGMLLSLDRRSGGMCFRWTRRAVPLGRPADAG